MLLDVSPKADDLRLPSDAPAVAIESEAIEIEKQSPTTPSFERLSEREQIILDHIVKGETNKHIARDLNVAEATVKVHVKAILRKVKVQNLYSGSNLGGEHPEIVRRCHDSACHAAGSGRGPCWLIPGGGCHRRSSASKALRWNSGRARLAAKDRSAACRNLIHGSSQAPIRTNHGL